ncbi:MAG: HypC/HybG/HupF family hydrogenase formation chaperone [candidate division Zixibacteria bacterium]|nr:HypC/HybG/HupF family hydrogenase formation chaperone [candidate division Zixibacteria bacterium]MBU1469903.1 HypC/HybG/HupF family hydrogenase formation chaperone [candidate division Zixibacteria bacterium]MBU2623998.1 HypC/HybG/HupF family hydrogenase formation chaperone [candidate division Zixibacteria bacterium]
MCLAVPGKLISKSDCEPMLRSGRIDFGGIVKDVSLAFVPEARLGDYLLVHAGIAIGIVDEEEVSRITDYLKEIHLQDLGDDRR